MVIKYCGVGEISRKWKVSERTVRYYCDAGRVAGSYLQGKTWMLPSDSIKPKRSMRRKSVPKDILNRLQYEKDLKIKGGIYNHLQISMAYNSNHIEGSRLTEEQTRLIFTSGKVSGEAEVDDIFETSNHFTALDFILDTVTHKLTRNYIKGLHRLLKQGTSDIRKGYAVGEWKKIPNEVAGLETSPPEEVPDRMKDLIDNYESAQYRDLESILSFHVNFEGIHPFQDGNGRVGRLLLFKECLRNDICPFIISDDIKSYYYRGLREWPRIKGFLLDTCRASQDDMISVCSRFCVTDYGHTG